MPSLKARARAAYDALMGKSPGQPVISAATVRPHEAGNSYATRFRRTEFAELAMRYVGTVKVADSRNSNAIGSLPLRVYADPGVVGQKSAYRRKAVGELDRRRLVRDAGRIARKAAGASAEIAEVVDEDFPLARLLERPAPGTNTFEFLAGLQSNLGIFGNGYVYKAMVGGFPVELWRLQPQYTTVIPDKDRFVGGYIFGRGTEIERKFTPDEVSQIKNPNPRGDPYYGLGDLAACCAEADLGRTFTLIAQEMCDNGVTPGIVVAAKGMTAAQGKELEDHLNAGFAGSAKTGKSLVLWGDLEIKTLNMGEKEMAFLSSQERIDQVIANCFDLSVAMLRLDSAALATAKAVVQHWQLMAIKPRAQRIEDFINSEIVRPYWPGYFVAFDNSVDKDTDAAAARVVALRGAKPRPVITLNEARAELDYEPEEGGDELEEAPPAPDPSMDGGLPLQGQDKEGGGSKRAKAAAGHAAAACMHRVIKEQEAQGQSHLYAVIHALQTCQEHLGGGGGGGAAPGGVASASTAGVQRKGGCGCGEHAGLSARGLLWQDSADRCCQPNRISRKDDKLHGQVIIANERQLEAALKQWFDGVTPHIVGSVTEAGALGVDLSSTTITSSFETAVQTVLSNLYQAGARAGVVDVRYHVDPQQLQRALTEGAQDYLRTQTAKLSESVTGTLGNRLGDTLADGVAAGENITQLRDRAMEVMQNASKAGAENIARTETSRAFLSAREEAWKASGVVEGKEWLLSADPCPLCVAMARKCNASMGGKAVPLGDALLALGATLAAADGSTMTNDYQVMNTPPLHPQCVLPDTLVSAGGIVAATRAWYSGNVVTVRTARGRNITTTQNHQMLGRGGFISAVAVHKGDYLVCRSFGDRGRPVLAGPALTEGPTRIQDVFTALRRSRGVATRRVPSAPVQFHGDGHSIHGEVEVVATESLLRDRLNASLAQKLCHRPLVMAGESALALAAKSEIDAMLLALRLAAYGRVGGFRESLAILRAGLAHSEIHRVAAPAWCDPELSQPEHYAGSANAVMLGECLDGLAGLVEVDEVVEVNIRPWSGHVYDLSTVSGMYIGSGIVTHNCRCSMGAVFKTPDAPAERATA